MRIIVPLMMVLTKKIQRDYKTIQNHFVENIVFDLDIDSVRLEQSSGFTIQF